MISPDFIGSPIVYYCKDCEKMVKAEPVRQKYVYRCAICKTKNVAFGTEKSISNYYHIEKEKEEKKDEKETKKTETKKIEAPVIPVASSSPSLNT